MPFALKIVSGAGVQWQAPKVMAMLRPRATIGRGSNCDLVLEDPSKQLSRVHVAVVESDGGYLLKVVSKVNFVLVNGQQFGPESSVSIKPGDRIQLGTYVIELLAHGEPKASADTSAPGTRAQAARAGARPVEDIIDTAPAVSALGGSPAETPSQPGNHQKKGLIEMLAEDAQTREPSAAGRATSSAERTFMDPGIRPESASQADTGTALLRAFLEGAELGHLKATDYDGVRFMRECGALVRTAIEGIIGLLMVRAEMRKEIHSEDRTMVSSQDNNPLRLMTDTSEALSYIFDPHTPTGAFLQPTDAVRDACSELRAHEIALMAAMRAAITGAIERFDPDKLDKELLKSRGRIRLGKKAALWDFFVAYQAKLERDVEDDFNRVFAREFLGTYTAQVQRLRDKH